MVLWVLAYCPLDPGLLYTGLLAFWILSYWFSESWLTVTGTGPLDPVLPVLWVVAYWPSGSLPTRSLNPDSQVL